LYLSAGFILEEGLPMETLWRVVQSMRRAADIARVQLVTGDTKVVDRGKGDGMFINTAGIGLVQADRSIGPASLQAGDVLLLNGDIGRHGIAIMAVREGLAFETAIESDTAPLADLVLALLDSGIDIHCMRDLTRGGLASALVEIAEAADLHIHIEERAIPVREDVRGACEILGFDPLYVANEGRFGCFVPADQAGLKTGDVIRAGDRLFLRLESSKDIHLYVINESADGEALALFPTQLDSRSTCSCSWTGGRQKPTATIWAMVIGCRPIRS
jgi:hydrogenase expression/formation protein HypE